MFTIVLDPNHRDLETKLIGIVANPEEFIAKWLKERSQFSIIEELSENGGDNNLSMQIHNDNSGYGVEEEKYTKSKWNVNKKLFQYTLRATKITHDITGINVSLTGDAKYYL